ncbi:hypothetical protein ACFLV7_11285 [Chloroflexota bacterium]
MDVGDLSYAKKEKTVHIPIVPSYIDGNKILSYKREPMGMQFILSLENGEERMLSIFEWMKSVETPTYL